MKQVITRKMGFCSLNLPLHHSIFNYDDYQLQNNAYNQEKNEQISFSLIFILSENMLQSLSYSVKVARKNKRKGSVVVSPTRFHFDESPSHCFEFSRLFIDPGICRHMCFWGSTHRGLYIVGEEHGAVPDDVGASAKMWTSLVFLVGVVPPCVSAEWIRILARVSKLITFLLLTTYASLTNTAATTKLEVLTDLL